MTPNSPDGAMGEGIAIDAAGKHLHRGGATPRRDEIRKELQGLTLRSQRDPEIGDREEAMTIWLTRLNGLRLLMFSALPAAAAEMKVLAYNAVNIPARELAAAFGKETGHQVTFTFGSPGPVNERLKAGEPFDLVVAAATEAAQAREALWRRPLVRVGIGLAVRESRRSTSQPSELDAQGAARRAVRLTLSENSRTGGLADRTRSRCWPNPRRSPIRPARASRPTVHRERRDRDRALRECQRDRAPRAWCSRARCLPRCRSISSTTPRSMTNAAPDQRAGALSRPRGDARGVDQGRT